MGISAALIWSSQGAYISECAGNKNKEKYISLFFGIFFLAGLSTQPVSALLIPTGKITFYVVMTIICIIGNALMCFLTPPLKIDEDDESEN